MRTPSKIVATVFAGAALAVAPAATASAAPALVDVTIQNVANNNEVTVAIPINAAANICGLQVGVLAQDLQQGDVECTSRAGQDVTISQ